MPKFYDEVAKWDRNVGKNDMLVSAKHMCIKLRSMIDFTRGMGSLKTTKDVIDMAFQLSKDGTKLDLLAREMVDIPHFHIPVDAESMIKKDLLSYLEQTALYCNQLRIIARVST